VYQRLDGRADLHEGAKWRNAGNRALYHVTDLELLDFVKPWVLRQLLDAEAQAVLVDRDDLGLDGLADLYVVAWVVDALPADLADVHQAFDTFDVHEDA